MATTVPISPARTTGMSVVRQIRLETTMFTTSPSAPTAPNLAASRASRSSRARSAPRSLMVIAQPRPVGFVNPAMLTSPPV